MTGSLVAQANAAFVDNVDPAKSDIRAIFALIESGWGVDVFTIKKQSAGVAGVTAFSFGTVGSYNSGAYSAGTASAGAEQFVIGTNVPSGDNAAVLVCRALSGASLFDHAFRDESTFTSTTTGAYASYDSIPVISGSTHYNHLRGFQSRPDFEGTGTMDGVAAFFSQPKVGGSGPVTNLYGLYIDDPTGSGAITNQYGIWVNTLSRGGSSNFAIYVATNASFFGGDIQVGPSAKITLDAFNGDPYGAVLSCDASGNVLHNPNLTIVNGVLSITRDGAIQLPSSTTTQKNALTPSAGMILYDSTLAKIQGYQGGAWQNLI